MATQSQEILRTGNRNTVLTRKCWKSKKRNPFMMKNNPRIILFLLFVVLGCSQKIIAPVQINIEFKGSVPKDHKIKMTLIETSKSQQKVYEGKIERRGGYSISFPKHSFEIDLQKDISLADLPEDDDWILNANYIDKTFLRHVLSYEIFSAMGPNNISSESRYVEVTLNNKYNGLYLLMEKLDKSSLDVDGSNSMGMIFKEPHIFRETYDGITARKLNNFHQQTYPKIKTEDKRDDIEAVREFILTTNNREFKEGISKVFDMENIIDWHLLLLISNNSDGILKNFYLYKVNTETPIRIAPWDYDHSFGRDGDNELNLDKRPLKIERSILFKRLLKFDWYRSKLKQKWLELNENNILSEIGLKRSVLIKSKRITNIVKKNFELWPIESQWYYDSNNFKKEIDIILKFIEVRHARLTKYFTEF